jgi:hypothetical protein
VSASGAFAFGDLESGRFGLAFLASDAADASGVATVFAEGQLAAGAEDAGGIEVEETEPSQRWHVTFTGDGAGFDLNFAALGEPAESGAGDDRLCRVTGTVTAQGQTEPIECLGQRGGAGSGPPEQGSLLRWVGAWLGEDEAIFARAQRSAGAQPDAEELSVFLVEGEPPVAVAVADPRLSTAYDGEGRHVRAGFELWVDEEDDYARRAAGEVVCATSLAFAGHRLDCAFLRWRMHGREGAGVYDILRPA